jgi:hypothetical protein
MTSQHIRTPRTAIQHCQGEESLKRNGGSSENTIRHLIWWFDGTINKESIDEAKAPEQDTPRIRTASNSQCRPHSWGRIRYITQSTGTKDLHKRRLQVACDIIDVSTARLVEPEQYFHLEVPMVARMGDEVRRRLQEVERCKKASPPSAQRIGHGFR